MRRSTGSSRPRNSKPSRRSPAQKASCWCRQARSRARAITLMRTSRDCVRPARRNWPGSNLTTHRETLDLPYRPEDLFDLAADVGRYPDFISWIQSLKLVSEEDEALR